MILYIVLIAIVIAIVIALVFVFKPKTTGPKTTVPKMGTYSEWKDTVGCVHCGDSVIQTRECSTQKCDGPSQKTRQCTGCQRYIQQYGLRCNVHEDDAVWGKPCRYVNGSFTSDPNPGHVYVYNPENKLYYHEKSKKCIDSSYQSVDCELGNSDLQWEVKGSDISPVNSDIAYRITSIS